MCDKKNSPLFELNMKPMPLPSKDGLLRLSLDVREKNIEVPRLLELEHALEPRHPARKQGAPKRSMYRVEVFRAIKAAGEYCTATVPELAQLACCSVRECQYAIADLIFLGWLQKLADVGKAGGVTPGRGAQKQGNLLCITRPSWAWDGTHHKRLWKLAVENRVGVHSMHPLVREALGVLEGQEGKAPNGFQRSQKRTGAQHAPLERVHGAKTPLSINRRAQEPKREGKRSTSKRVEWPAKGKGFLRAWELKYQRGPFPDQAALDAYNELCLKVGGAAGAEDLAKRFVAMNDDWLTQRNHPLGWLRKHWPSVPKPKAGPVRRQVQAAGEDALSRLGDR
jgi:hypothetical protein